MKTRATFLCIALLSFMYVGAQPNPSLLPNQSPYSSSIGLLGGTTGFGFDFYHPIGNQLGFQIGFSLMPFQTQIIGDYGQHATRSRVDAQMHNVHALLGWTPFYRAGSFVRHFTIHAGVAYFIRADGSIHTTLNEPYFFGDIEVPPSMIGAVTTDIDWKTSVSPYVGLGLTNVRIDNRFGFNCTVGGYLLASPKVQLTGTELMANNGANAEIIERNLESYRYLPQIQLGINYRLRLQ